VGGIGALLSASFSTWSQKGWPGTLAIAALCSCTYSNASIKNLFECEYNLITSRHRQRVYVMQMQWLKLQLLAKGYAAHRRCTAIN
jgi:hypothetical protein